MKKILYTLLAGAMALSSCSKSDDVPTAPQSESTTFTLAVDGAETRATNTVTPVRYVMEVWSEDGLTAENVFENGTTNHAQITSGNMFTVALDKAKAYTCLFWADFDADNTTGVFNAASLKTISPNAGKDATEAYHAHITIPKDKPYAISVTLKRAVAKITLAEMGAVNVADNIALKLTNIYSTFNVLDGTATGTAAEWTKTIQPAATTGTIATFYFFAKTDKELSNLTFTYAADPSKTVSNISVQQNYATSIKGEYSNLSSFTFDIGADDVWNTPDNDFVFPIKAKVGDFYYSDDTYSSTYDNTKTCIGIVFYMEANGRSGKVVGLTEVTDKVWGVRGVTEVSGNPPTTDGVNATKNLIKAHKDDANFAAAYAAFDWIYSVVNNGNVDGRWYMPSKVELETIYSAWNGDDTDTANFAARAAFNRKLTTAGGEILQKWYWSSTECDIKDWAWICAFNDRAQSVSDSKENVNGVRAITAF